MSDVMRPIPFGNLMNWILEDYKKEGRIFGIEKIVRHKNTQALPIFEEKIEAPFGPAAGPNTQLAQNIIASYAAGARFFELKTVQIMDGPELAACVNKPCIIAGDECYNCEWSTELYVSQAYEEYVKAWVAIKLAAREFGLGDPDAFVFNMSVGYDLEGIKSEKIDTYLNDMKDASGNRVFRECIQWALDNAGRFENVDEDYIRSISPKISASVTESTLHGCPPDEIERIATYLMTQKGLHTFIKCNPTLLGYEYARDRLDSLGFDYVAFDDHHFLEDLQWEDALPMFRRLISLSEEKGLEFGIKLTNTFPVDVKAGELPSEEMYMAGRSLFPLTIHLASLISDEFDGALRISWSGGAVMENIRSLFDAGIWPITMATNILKPGGYQRMSQISEVLADCPAKRFERIDPKAVAAIDEAVAGNKLYRKGVKPLPKRHMDKKLPLFDCFTSPCRKGCPIKQDIPAYLQAMMENKPEKALDIILERNPLPFITGTICPHHCGDKCMRNYYEETLHIRETKLAAAKASWQQALDRIVTDKARWPGSEGAKGKKCAVVGAGPAGISAAAFLARAGAEVTVFEKRGEVGGVVRHVIPDFRITSDAVEKDAAFARAWGAVFETGREIGDVSELFGEGYTDVILAVGAWHEGSAGLKYGEALDALEFLQAAKQDPALVELGRQVVVLGGGNTAMDVARAAKRMPGVEKVRLVYRRTRRFMPAEEEELQMALDEGVEMIELLAPIGVSEGMLECAVMELGEPDDSGRRSPVDTGKTCKVPADSVIAAVGERIDPTLFEKSGIALDPKGRPVVDETMQTSIPHVYAAGDGRRGPATVVEAIADAAKAAAAITGICFDRFRDENSAAGADSYSYKKGMISTDLTQMPDWRCLGCPAVCEVCADVCPNRANVAIQVPGKTQTQILHIDGMCNECGNCAVFCPWNGRPYKDKFTLFWSREDFADSTNEGFLVLEGDRVLVRLDGQEKEYGLKEVDQLGEDAAAMIRTVVKEYAFLLK